MSDALVQIQEWIAHYPSWMVAGAIGFLVVVVGVIFWRAMKIAMTALIVAIVVAGAWFVWEKINHADKTLAAPAANAPAPAAIEPARP